MSETNVRENIENCIVDGKVYNLNDIEKMGFDNFSLRSHMFPYKSLFRYYPNIRKYVKEEKRYRNYSFESLVNNTVFLQDAKNFDDCFDCAIDLDFDKFLNNRLNKYCEYFKIDINDEKDINVWLYRLSVLFYTYGSVEKVLSHSMQFNDEVQRLTIGIFVRNVFVDVTKNKLQWQEAICSAVRKEYIDFCDSLSKFRICCFSTSPYLNRMWSSAYANNNQGFCIEYEIDLNDKSNIDIYNSIFPVIYSQKRNDYLPLSMNIDKTPSKDDLWQMYFNGLLRKSKHWKDQKEWRLILPKGLITQNPLPFLKIKKVYLGNKMPEKDKIKIIRYCKKNKIEYVGIIRKIDSFDLIECSFDCAKCYKLNSKIKD